MDTSLNVCRMLNDSTRLHKNRFYILYDDSNYNFLITKQDFYDSSGEEYIIENGELYKIHRVKMDVVYEDYRKKPWYKKLW